MRAVLAVLFTVSLAAACSSSGPSPSPIPAPNPSPSPPPAAAQVVLSGLVSDTVEAQPLAGVTVAIGADPVVTDAGGVFRHEWTAGHPLYTLLRLTGPDIVERSLTVSMPQSRHVSLDVIRLGGGFDLEYYRRFVRDELDDPGSYRSLRRWTQAPRFYIRTIDEEGEPVSVETIDQVEAVLRDDPQAWTGGLFGIADVERGTETREGVSGWITVRWPETEEALCGRAQVAIDGGWMEFYRRPGCGCPGIEIAPALVRHELGHAMGFYHTGDRDDVMWTPLSTCDTRPSVRERLHAAVAYRRPVGNTDPDDDPQGLFQSRVDEPIVIVD